MEKETEYFFLLVIKDKNITIILDRKKKRFYKNYDLCTSHCLVETRIKETKCLCSGAVILEFSRMLAKHVTNIQYRCRHLYFQNIK